MACTLYGVRLPTVPSGFKVGINGSNSHADRRNAHLSFFLKYKYHSRKVSAGKSFDSVSQSSRATGSEKVLFPGTENEETLSSTEELEVPQIVSDDSQISGDVESSEMEHGIKINSLDKSVEQSSSEAMTGEDSKSVMLLNGDVQAAAEATSYASYESISVESDRVGNRVIPPPGNGQNIYEIDAILSNYSEHLDYRYDQYRRMREAIDKYEGGLEKFSRGYEKFGFTRSETGVTYREWAPGAKSAMLIGDFNNWNPDAGVMTCNEFGVWEIFLPNSTDGSPAITHGSRVKIRMDTPSGFKDSIPSWIKFSVQAPGEIPYNGIYYDPPEEGKYFFNHPQPKKPKSLRIYESHIGMSSTSPRDMTFENCEEESH